MMRKPTGNLRGRPRAFNIEEALYAAMCVFADKGYESASLTDLTKAMGINRTSMYAAFGNKEGLFRKALDFYTQTMQAQFSSILKDGPVLEGMKRIFAAGVEMFTDPEGPGPCLIVQGPLNGEEMPEDIRRFFADKRETPYRMFKHRFERAQAEGELPKDISADDLARFYSTVVQGLALQAQHGADKQTLMSIVRVALAQWPQKPAS